jgi:hypothetical protein
LFEKILSGLMKQKISWKDKIFKKLIHLKFNNIGSVDKNKYKNITTEISSSVRSLNASSLFYIMCSTIN